MNKNPRNIVLIGKLSITNWEAKKKDKHIETEAEAKAGSKRGTVSARKVLLPGAESLEAIIKHSAAMRTWWNTCSQPWFDNGMRAYNIAGHMDIQMAYGDMARYRDTLVEEFLGEYAALREVARFDLNDLFNDADYPDVNVVRSKFTCSFECMPLPNTEDFRIIEGLSDEEIAELTASAERKMQARIYEASKNAVEQLYKSVKLMIDRLEEYNAKEDADTKNNKFYDSWIDNVRKQARLIPQLNITDDPELAALGQECLDLVADDTALFKGNRSVRETATQKADSIAAKLKSLFSED
jgi:hypothetical protein